MYAVLGQRPNILNPNTQVKGVPQAKCKGRMIFARSRLGMGLRSVH